MSENAPRVAGFEIGLAVLGAFDRESPRLTIGQIAARCSISRFAARRYPTTLVALGYADMPNPTEVRRTPFGVCCAACGELPTRRANISDALQHRTTHWRFAILVHYPHQNA